MTTTLLKGVELCWIRYYPIAVQETGHVTYEADTIQPIDFGAGSWYVIILLLLDTIQLFFELYGYDEYRETLRIVFL